MKNLRGILLLLCASSIAFAAEDPRFEQGARFEAAGKYENALGEYRSILASDPHNANAFYAAGAVRLKMKDYKGAIANFQLAYKYAPKMQEAYEGSATAYEKLGDQKSAAAERAKNPSYKAPKSEAKAEAKAEVKTEKAAKSDSKYSYNSAALLKAKQAFNAKEYKTTCTAAREVLLQEPGNPGAYYYAGVGRYELGEMDKAEYNLKRAFDYPELGYNAHYYLSLIYRKQGKKKEELAELEAYVRLSKNETAIASAKNRIAELSGAEPKAPEAKIAEVKPAEVKPVEVKTVEEKPVETVESKPVEAPKPDKQRKLADPSIEQANDAYVQGDYVSALSQYQALQKKFRDEDTKAYLLFQIGNVYRCRRDYRSAVAKYREAVEYYPNSEWANEAQRAWEDAVWQEKNADALPRH
ncbi:MULTISPECIES: tetratricopeptide repeat protein [Hallerella]|uniref:tetratricopeptide repeat protein n=1 Tax=Hallerella TaxID=2815788 RepID=UPI00258A9EE8|nr:MULTISPECIES: tetratricopeptide repeat protein [Hallerella]MCI6874146.1 tetratricopeptide repeat protein [Hallerella sp.]MDY5029837.1 tetratricopeptide repeat protein [Hallerella succinigenes]